MIDVDPYIVIGQKQYKLTNSDLQGVEAVSSLTISGKRVKASLIFM